MKTLEQTRDSTDEFCIPSSNLLYFYISFPWKFLFIQGTDVTHLGVFLKRCSEHPHFNNVMYKVNVIVTLLTEQLSLFLEGQAALDFQSRE